MRDTRKGKGRFDLIPVEVLYRDAKHYENGAEKYGDRNWEKGQPVSRYYDSAVRHLLQWMAGADDEDHLAAVRWNVGAIMWTEMQVADNKLPSTLVDVGPHAIEPEEWAAAKQAGNDFNVMMEVAGRNETKD